jgi:hypothetical protein
VAAKHWTADLFVLAYFSDEGEAGLRMRWTTSASRDAILARYARVWHEHCDPALYGPGMKRIPLPPGRPILADEDAARTAKRPAPKRKKASV